MFSIIIPSYNTEQFLPYCLQSIECQTFRNFEVIVVDDGSTDSTGLIADAFADCNEKVTVLHGENEGLLLARRKGLESAKGDYVVFVDADDALRQDALEILALTIQESDVDIVVFAYSRYADYSEIAMDLPLPEGIYSGSYFQYVKECACGGRMNSLWGKAIRRSCIDFNNKYQDYRGLMHGEDLIQLLPIVDRCSSAAFINSPLYYYRPSGEASTARFRLSQLSDIARVNSRLLEYGSLWGSDCINASIIGESKQYLYLLKIVGNDHISSQEKAWAYAAIRNKMLEEGSFSRAHYVRHRLDDYLVLLFLEAGHIAISRFLINIVDVIKNTLHSVRRVFPRSILRTR